MKSSQRLLLAMGEIAAHHIEDADTYVAPHRNRWIKPLVAAACVGITLITAIPLVAHHRAILSPTENDFLSAQHPAPQNITLTELIARSDAILCGDIIAEHRVQSRTSKTPFTTADPLMNVPDMDTAYEHTVTLLVEDVLKGDVAVGDYLDISNAAHDTYDKDGRFLGVVFLGDAALMKNGDRVLVFLTKPFPDTYEYRLVGESGKWFLGDDHQYHCGVCFDTRFPHSFTPRIGLEEYTPLSIDELRTFIQE